MVPFPSSLTRRAPSCATATPTGRAQTEESFTTKPVMKSSYSPVGIPSFRRARITFRERCFERVSWDRLFGSGNERSPADDAHSCCLDRFLAWRYIWRCCAASSAHRHRSCVRYRPAVDHHARFQLHRLLRWCIRSSQTWRFDTEENKIKGAEGWGERFQRRHADGNRQLTNFLP